MKKITLLVVMLIASFNLATAQLLTSIDSIQRISAANLAVGNDLSAKTNDTLWIEGVCMFNPCLYAQSGSVGYPQRLSTFLQDTATSAHEWAGVQIMLDPAAIGMTNAKDSVTALDNYTNFINNFTPGTLVKCRGIVKDFNGNTQFSLIKTSSVAVGPHAMPAPVVVTIDTFERLNGSTSLQDIQYLSGEKYEGMYVQINNPLVTNVSTTTANRYRWSIKDASGNIIEIQDNVSGNFTNTNYDMYCTGNNGTSGTLTTYTGPANGAALSFVKGIIVQNLNTTTGLKYYSLAPVLLSDVGATTFAPPTIANVHINPICPTATQTVTVTADVQDDSTVTTVNCHYAFGLTNPTFLSVPMTLAAGVTYTGTIPATVTDSTWVKYYIEAIDNHGHVTNYPDVQATNSYYLAINSGINSIRAIQGRMFVNGKSIYANDSLTGINIQGIVTATYQTDDLGMVAIQDGTSPFSGIFLSGGNTVNLHRGEKVNITAGKINEVAGTNLLSNVGSTTISNPTYTVVSANNTLPTPIASLVIDSVIANKLPFAEPFEAMLVGFASVAVIDTNPDHLAVPPSNFGEFSIHPTSTAPKGLRCDDFSNNIAFGFNTDSLSNGQNLCFVNGILIYAFGNWKMYPRNLDDICGFNTVYTKQITSFTINSVPGFINQTAKTIDVALPAGTNVTALQPSITFIGKTITPGDGVATDFTTPQTYTVTASDNATVNYTVTVTVPLGINNVNGVGQVSVYPNPVGNELSVIGNQLSGNTNTIHIYDVLGREVVMLSVVEASKSKAINVANLPSGIYFLKITDAKGQTGMTKFVKQ